MCEVPPAAAVLSRLRDELCMSAECFRSAEAYVAWAAGGFARADGRCLAAGAALLACRRHNADRTVSDVAGAAGLPGRDAYMAYVRLRERLASGGGCTARCAPKPTDGAPGGGAPAGVRARRPPQADPAPDARVRRGPFAAPREPA